jgi:lipopolysaccharide export system protein LptA
MNLEREQKSEKPKCGTSLYPVFYLFFVLFRGIIPCNAQEEIQIKKIEINRYASMEFDESIASDAMRLLGDEETNVEFVHDDVIMTCDSAYYYSDLNTLDAFSRVHITRSDGNVTVDGDFAKYQGNIKFAEIWGNVVLEDEDAVLKTRHLYYDLTTNIAYYLSGAEIFNKGNDLVSELGYYYRNTNMFYFKKDVVLHTPDYTIVTDTLDYNVHTKLSDFVGPTYIQNEADTIFCERGWYNTNDTVALFRQNAWIKSGSTTVNGDTLFYESATGNGWAFGNIEIVDTTNNVILLGNKGEYNNITERAWLTDSAILIMAGEQDSLFLHADTLRSDIDTSGFKILKAYYQVRFFSQDMQGKCDSLALSLQDSVIHLFKKPVLWAQDNQMTAEHIEIETENQNPKKMNMLNKGFIVNIEDSTWFNQIKGRRIVAFFREGNELYRINVYDDSQSLYYLKDGPDVIGYNKANGKNMVIDVVDKKADIITVIDPAGGEVVPPNEFIQDEQFLTGFQWLMEEKPVDKHDIFPKKKSSKKEPEEETEEEPEGEPEKDAPAKQLDEPEKNRDRQTLKIPDNKIPAEQEEMIK